ncbi:MAG TPA: threonine synthase [Candidatus Atribacteria bacterium]|nr:threonine synthase [Candidatus Atribacteria bacterium]
MLYESTRDKNSRLTSMDAIKQGISKEGGLFVPEAFPRLGTEDLSDLAAGDYTMRARHILKLFLSDYKEEDIDRCIEAAYVNGAFPPGVAPVVSLCPGLDVLELWHGPTCAFKDMALQLLPHLMTTAIRATGEQKEIVILTATSGDTGKAALEGFRDVEGTRIIVFYPVHGVSSMQRLQMITQKGRNTKVIAVEGNFDDAQSGVKSIFGSDLDDRLDKAGYRLSSANSINWGRLVPQIVYYFSAYLDLINQGRIKKWQTVNVVVPTGNFGNILAAYYAKRMGLPLGRLICASNRNNVLTDFISTGVYDINRIFYKTTSPSMDILISSNLERLLYEMSERDTDFVSGLMRELKERGRYKVDGQLLNRLNDLFWGSYADEGQTRATIKDTFEKYGYTLDPHTAVGKFVYDQYRLQTGDTTETILVSTASPFKFPAEVLKALGYEGDVPDEAACLEDLSRVTGVPVPAPLESLSHSEVLHKDVCSREGMKQALLSYLKL